MPKILNALPVGTVSITGHIVNPVNSVTSSASSGSNSASNSHTTSNLFCLDNPADNNNCDLCEETSKIMDIVNDIKSVQSETAQGCITLNDDDVDSLYNNFISPYLNCDLGGIGNILEIIRLRDLINYEIDKAKLEKTKTLLKIMKDILTVIINAKNDKYELDIFKKRVNYYKELYLESLKKITLLETQIKVLNGDKSDFGVKIKGTTNITLTKFKPLIYFTALFNCERAWYLYMYEDCKNIDPDKYKETINYITTKFSCKKDAYDELIKLLDEKYKNEDGSWK